MNCNSILPSGKRLSLNGIYGMIRRWIDTHMQN